MLVAYQLTSRCLVCRGARLLFGDQTLFCRKRDFEHVGGFDERLLIMEDADLCIRLHEAGPVGDLAQAPCPGLPHTARQQGHRDQSNIPAAAGAHSANVPTHRCRGRVKLVWWPVAETSGRRLAAWGNLKATWIHFQLGLRWYLGASPKQLQELYHRMYTDSFR